LLKGKHFIISLSLILLSGFISVSLLSYFSARGSLSEQVVSQILPLTGESVYSQIRQQLREPVSLASMMSHDTFLRDWVINGEKDSSQITRYLAEIQKKYGSTTSFFISDKTRHYYHPRGIVGEVRLDNPHDIWFFRTKNMQQDYEINIDLERRVRQMLTVFINHKVYDYQENFIGIAGVGISVDNLQQMIRRYRKQMGLEIYFTDRNGNILLGSSDKIRYQNIRHIPGLNQLSPELLSQKSDRYQYHRDNSLIHLNIRLISEFNWFLIVERQDNPWDPRIWQPFLINLLIGTLISIVILILVLSLIARHHQQLKQQAITDKLSGALNRQGFEDIWQSKNKRITDPGHPMQCLLIDIDHFKKINDTFGHLAGDQVITDISDIIRRHISHKDAFIRWGGEEFMILAEDTDQSEAISKAELIREQISQYVKASSQDNNKGHTVTVSTGITQWIPDEAADTMIHRADLALYQAKKSGRNRVKVNSVTESTTIT